MAPAERDGGSTPASAYVFGDVALDRELPRLRQIEEALDPASRRLLEVAGPAPGTTCLEVGAGAGSIATWLADAVGRNGKVVALDLAPRFAPSPERPQLRVVQGDIREWDGGEYDLVHARYVLIHVADAARALERVAASVRPGGWVVLEEPDFLASRFASGPAEEGASFDRVNAAIARMFRDRGMDPGFGARLPAMLQSLGLALVSVESEAHLVPGGSRMAMMMGASTAQLREKYVATGLASDDDIERYVRFAGDPGAWGLYYATVRVVARR
jgi:SAM-dependent methyltransferase